MKSKLFISAAFLMVCSVVVYAGAQKIVLTVGDNPEYDDITAEEGIHENANGFVVINKTPEGSTDVTIQIQLRGAAPEYAYIVKSGGEELGTVTTNKKGSGGLHINLTDETELGAAINIWTSDGSTARLLRAML